ncbi:MAG: hypothetical protein AAFZ65_14540 [Planctomycetota bacterium]
MIFLLREGFLLQAALDEWEASGDPFAFEELPWSDPGLGEPFAAFEARFEAALRNAPRVFELLEEPPYRWDAGYEDPEDELDPVLEELSQKFERMKERLEEAGFEFPPAPPARVVTLDPDLAELASRVRLRLSEAPDGSLEPVGEVEGGAELHRWRCLESLRPTASGSQLYSLGELTHAIDRRVLDGAEELGSLANVDWRARSLETARRAGMLFAYPPNITHELQGLLAREAAWSVSSGAEPAVVGAALIDAAWGWMQTPGGFDRLPGLYRADAFQLWTLLGSFCAAYSDQASLAFLEQEVRALDPLEELVSTLIGVRVRGDVLLSRQRPKSIPEGAWGGPETGQIVRYVQRLILLRNRRLMAEWTTAALAKTRADGLDAELEWAPQEDWAFLQGYAVDLEEMLEAARNFETNRRLVLLGLAFELRGERGLEAALERHSDPRNGSRRFERLVREDGVEVLRSPDPDPPTADWDQEPKHLDWALGRFSADLPREDTEASGGEHGSEEIGSNR